ncbi:MAG TPA: PIN domain-containing protein [Bryobacteraceae bacterium]|nr:PIN domain-containing protein [Bryobacteraceae bacterium]
MSEVQRFAAGLIDIACDIVVREYGRLRQDLREQGRPIPENDMWIAATATRQGLALVTRDRHFLEADGLALASW